MARLSLPTVPSSRGSCFRHCYTPSFPGNAELHHPQLRRAPALVWASRLSEALVGSQVLQAERARAPGRGGAGRGVVTLPLVLGPGRGRGSAALTPHPPALAALACWGSRCRAPTALRPPFLALKYLACWPRTFQSPVRVLRTMPVRSLVLLVVLLLWPSFLPAYPSE